MIIQEVTSRKFFIVLLGHEFPCNISTGQVFLYNKSTNSRVDYSGKVGNGISLTGRWLNL